MQCDLGRIWAPGLWAPGLWAPGLWAPVCVLLARLMLLAHAESEYYNH